MRIRIPLLLTAATLLACVSCTKRPARPRFETLAVDTLVRANGFDCRFEYRFASIANAAASPALKAIERANIGYFFELEAFDGSAQEAAARSIEQTVRDMALPAKADEETTRPAWEGEISADSEGKVVDTLLCYTIEWSSYTGGAHGNYGIRCHTYSLRDGFELSLADLFTEAQLAHLETFIRHDLYQQYEARSDEELEAKGFFPEYIGMTENFLVTEEGITFYYNPYDIGCYALGPVEVTITREELAGL